MLHRMIKKGSLYLNSLNNPIYLNSFYLMLSSLTASATGFIFWVIVARFYTVTDVGVASAIISAVGLISVISLLGLDISLVRFIPDNKCKTNELINTCVYLVVVISLVTSLVISLVVLSIGILEDSPQTPNVEVLPIILITLSLVTSVQSLQNQGIFVGLRKNKYSFFQTISSVIRLGLVPILAFVGSIGIILAYGISSIFALILGFVIMKKLDCFPHFRMNKSVLHKIIHFSLGNYIARVFEILPTYLMPLIIITMLNAEASAYFYIAWSISMLLLIISKSVSSSLLAEATHNPENIRSLLKRSLLWTFGLLIPTIITICLSGEYVLLMFGSNYAENAYDILIILGIASIPFSANTLYATACRIRGDVLSIILIYGIIGISTVVGSILSLQSFGLYGGAGSWMLANILALIFVALNSSKFKRTQTTKVDVI